MSEQLSVFQVCSDSDPVSLQNTRSDAKSQAIQRFLNQRKSEPSICVNTYSPGRRATEYYRLSYQWHGKKKHVHIKGGSTIAELATYRAQKLQGLIDRGAELAEVIAAVRTFNGG
ncbi:MAG: hypothetical protein RLZZ574_2658 [Cyanobacteriota bacterium]|jgi:hypothetical protein